MINWGPYLESVCQKYGRWWEVYTLTDVAGKRPHEQQQNIFPFLDLGLMVQRVKSEERQGKDPQEKIERLTVLEGLRKYAANHVLLVGRPGSGKSTALARLLLEEAHKVWSGENGQIPILIELRYSKSSILSRIQAFIYKHNHNTYIDEEILKSLLLQGEFLLLFDGFNEMASEEARQQVRMFRQDYPQTAMVFSTRDLSLGGDLWIEKKLEMQPLTESQMQDFVCAYLPEQGEILWGQLQGRLRELGETPMFLWMLCSVFYDNNVIPAHLGLVFRGFTQTYSGRIKQDVPVDKNSRRWWDRLLQELAWVMTTGGSKTEMMVAIPRKKAEDVLADFLRGEVVAPTDCAMGWLEDLLEHHLLQVGDDGQISFRHQLLQEYYAAERLLLQLPGLSDYELQWDYLNYLKWTEVVALMLALVEDEVLAVRVVRLALEVDWFLAARLVGEVKEKFQEAAFAEVDGLELPELVKVKLAGLTMSEVAVPRLVRFLEDSDEDVCFTAENALGQIASETAIKRLIPLLKDSDQSVRKSAASALSRIGSEKAIEQLILLLKDSEWEVRREAAEALGKIGSENTIIELTKKLQNDSLVKQDLSRIITAIQTIQQRLQYYKPTPKIPMSKSLSHNYALLIGVGDCKYPDWSLPVTVKDIQAIKSFLTNPDFCSYIDDENHLRLLCNEQATKQNILNNINWLQEQAKNDPEATILVYYSGHGWLDKSTQNYYLIPHDTSPIKLQKTALPATDFNNALQEISAQKLLVIIDSCHAQGMATAKETDQLDLPENFSQTALPKNLIEDLKKGTGRAVFTSSTGYQLSWIRSDQTMSIYTYHLLEALQGGDNKPGDKYVTLSNLMHHVGKTVPQSAQQQGGEQTPIFDLSQTEDFPVALLRGGKGLPEGGWEKTQPEAQENIRNAITVQQGNAAGRDVKNQVFIEKLEGGANFS